jgi:hypothetical protein
LRVDDLTVRVCVDDDHSSYRFRCPSCALAVVHDTTAAICSLLVSVGVQEERWRMPTDLTEQHTGPMLTPDDLLDFHFLLQRDDWADHFTSVGDSAGRRS